jgi:hypothetical protein
MTRSVAILGDLLGGLSDQYFQAGKKYALIIANIGRFFWGIVELSVPNSLGSRFMRHWLAVLTALALLMIAFGIIFRVDAMAPFGGKFLAAIAAVAIASDILRKYMLKAAWPKRMIAGIIALAMLGILIWLVATYGPQISNAILWLNHLPQHLHAVIAKVEAWLKCMFAA